MVGIGERLRRAREARGLSLEDAQEATKIRRQHLAALEDERWGALPSAVYARGFLRLYARFLGLDVEALVSLYSSPPEPAPPPSPAPVAGPGRRWLVIGLMIALAAAWGWSHSRQEGAGLFSSQRSFAIVIPPVTPTPIMMMPLPTPKLAPATPTPTPTAVPMDTPASPVQMPPVGNWRYDDARARLEAVGLIVVRQDSPSSEVPPGVVFVQNPPPGQEVSRGQTALLRVSTGPAATTVVPKVKGKTEEEARRELAAAGLAVSPWVNYQQGPHVGWTCVGCVLSITPAEGSIVPRSSTVALAVREN